MANRDSGRVREWTHPGYRNIRLLGKGAAGQAVQNLNCMLGLDETVGLGSLVPALP